MKINELSRKRNRTGWLFILPWLIGLLLFFVKPIISFLIYSFTDFHFVEGGYELGVLENGLFANYSDMFFKDSNFPVKLVSAFGELLYKTPIIVFFSLFVATILNQPFKGRTLMRTIFFLPIIIMSGVVMEIMQRNMTSISTLESTEGALFSVAALTEILQETGLPTVLTDTLTTIVSEVGSLIWDSGIQILIFLSALLSIPAAYFEAAQMEGASGWEIFWKITFPMVSPFILANAVYTIVDSYANYGNEVMLYIQSYFTKDMNISYAAAMTWVYLLMVMIVLAMVFLICKRFLFYNTSR